MSDLDSLGLGDSNTDNSVITAVKEFDALVIGAGAGGMCAAVRLAHEGYRILLVETHDRLGGRASTRDVDGFLINTGALAIERGGMVDETAQLVGAPLNLFIPKPETVLIWGKRQFNIGAGVAAVMRNTAPHLLSAATAIIPPLRPKKGQVVTQWLNKFSKSKKLHGLINNVNCAMFAATNDELPADVFLHYFTKGSAFKKIGFGIGGTVEVWNPMGAVVEKKGGEVWLSSSVKKLNFDAKGLVNGADIERNGKTVSVATKLVVSNAGPLATVAIAGVDNFPKAYTKKVEEATDPSAIITVHFASQTPLFKFAGLALFAETRRLSYAANFSDPAQKRCPEGWYLYSAASSPHPARGKFDVEAEKELLMADLRDVIPNFDNAKILAVDVTAHEWPAQRAITGYDLPNETPIDNLWNVGDGVKPWGDAGTASCAQTGRIVVEQILQKYPLSKG